MRAKANLPKLKNLEKAVGRKRFANGQQVSVPHLISEINIPEQLQRTKTDLNENFILAVQVADTVEVRNWFRQLAQIFLEVYDDGDVDGLLHIFFIHFENFSF
uniref:Uncharacterized protein n=1 Tax=Meloidogyne enterolobii TaxID=390850 RepID=A0A6V7UMD0_MELEN|nr:unnamed protein product [Meloidogyne enterolobii]